MTDRIFAPPDEDDIRRFMSLSIEDRLKWLEEAKEFIFSTMPPENKRLWDKLSKAQAK